nr:RNA polymerase sigma factor [uncultured Roseateles sp.]
MTSRELDRWFVKEVLPLEASLLRFLRRNWRDESELLDIRQDVYMRVYESASQKLPDLVRPFVFATARNLLADRARRAQIVSIEIVADLDALEPAADELSPERHASGRSELRLLQLALEELPRKCRRVVELRKIDGLSQREVARQLGIAEDTVERHVSIGIRALADALFAQGVRLGTKAFSLARTARESLQ